MGDGISDRIRISDDPNPGGSDPIPIRRGRMIRFFGSDRRIGFFFGTLLLSNENIFERHSKARIEKVIQKKVDRVA